MSGIYIHGLSMPRKTGIVSIVLSGDGSALLCEDGAYSEIKVIPVPDHGRLINMDSKTFPTPHRNPSNDYMRGWNACLRSVQQQPTIIPASKEGEE